MIPQRLVSFKGPSHLRCNIVNDTKDILQNWKYYELQYLRILFTIYSIIYNPLTPKESMMNDLLVVGENGE